MFRKLLVPLDRSRLAEQALGVAAAIARNSNAEIELALVHQRVPFAGFAEAPLDAHQLKDEERYLARIAERLSSSDIPTTYAVLFGDVVEKICERAKEIEADLIVITSHGRTGLSRAWLGSVADGVVRQCAIPVLMLRAIMANFDRFGTHHRFEKILVPLDGSDFATNILGSASSLGDPDATRFVLIRIVQPVPLLTPEIGVPFAYPISSPDVAATNRLVDQAERQLANAALTLREQGITAVETKVIVGAHVAHEIIEFARKNDVNVVAMSTHGRGMSRLLIGSVADKVLRACGLPMLLECPARSDTTSTIAESSTDAGDLLLSLA